MQKTNCKEVFDFGLYESMRFTQHHKTNIFPELFTDEEYRCKIAMIGLLIRQQIFEYVVSEEYANTPITPETCMCEVYNLIHSDEVLEELLLSGSYINPKNAITTRYTLPQRCHVASALYALTDPNLELYTGISDRYNVHSWLVNKTTNQIVETTNIVRDCYYGIKVKDKVKFIEPLLPMIREIYETDPVFKGFKQRIEEGILALFEKQT